MDTSHGHGRDVSSGISRSYAILAQSILTKSKHLESEPGSGPCHTIAVSPRDFSVAAARRTDASDDSVDEQPKAGIESELVPTAISTGITSIESPCGFQVDAQVTLHITCALTGTMLCIVQVALDSNVRQLKGSVERQIGKSAKGEELRLLMSEVVLHDAELVRSVIARANSSDAHVQLLRVPAWCWQSEYNGFMPTFTAVRMLGSGCFGVVYEAKVDQTGQTVAIKQVLQDERFKNREVKVMKQLHHPNIVELKHAFFTSSDEESQKTYLNIVMACYPENLLSVARRYSALERLVPLLLVQLYSYQLSRALAHAHALGICHRDVQSSNILLDRNHALKLADWGAAKRLVAGKPNVAYICGRCHRSPEEMLGATHYTLAVDIWASGCVTAELILGRPLFPGDSSVEKLVEVIKILGTPSLEEIAEFNLSSTDFKFPQVDGHSWTKVFEGKATAESIDYVSKLLRYSGRPSGLQCCAHAFFDDLRLEDTHTSTTNLMPDNLFLFSSKEWDSMDSGLIAKLVPSWFRS